MVFPLGITETKEVSYACRDGHILISRGVIKVRNVTTGRIVQVIEFMIYDFSRLVLIRVKKDQFSFIVELNEKKLFIHLSLMLIANQLQAQVNGRFLLSMVEWDI